MEIDRLEVRIESQTRAANRGLNQLAKNLDKVAASLKNTNLQNITINNNLIKQVKSTKDSKKEVDKAAEATRLWKNATQSLYLLAIKVYAVFKFIQRAVQAVGKQIKSSMDYVETVNLFQTTFRKLGRDEAEKYGEDVADAFYDKFEERFLSRAEAMTKKMQVLGYDPDTIMNYQSRFAQMANSMGLVSETAINISDAFTALGADISSLFNIEMDDAMKKLQSGLAGQIRPMRQLGVDISKTALMQTAYNYGITESIEKMSAATKVQLRFLTTIQQLRITMGDMAKTINSPANQLRILTAQLQMLGRAIGNLLLPLATKVLPYLNGIVMALTRFVNELAILSGYEAPDFKWTEMYDDSVLDMAEDMDEAEDSAKKLKRALMGFDELNVLSQDSGALTDPNTANGYAVLDEAIMKEWKEYEKYLNKMMKQMSNKAQSIADRIYPKIKGIYDFFKKYPEIIWAIVGGLTAIAGISIVSDIAVLVINISKAYDWLSKMGATSMITKLAKVVSGVGGIAAGFLSMRNYGKEAYDGTLTLWKALLDFGIGVGGMFMAGAVFGPAGVVAAGVAMLAGLAIGIDEAQKAAQKENLMKKMFDDTKISIDKLSDAFSDLIDAFAAKYKPIDDLAGKLDNTKNSAEDAADAIGGILTQFKNTTGELDETQVPKLKELNKQVYDSTKEKIEAAGKIITTALQGAWRTAVAEIGIDVDKLLGEFYLLQAGMNKKLAQNYARMNELVDLFSQKDLTPKQKQEYYSEYEKLVKETIAAQSVDINLITTKDNFDTLIKKADKGINYKSPEEIANFVSEIETAFQSGLDAAESARKNTIKAIETFRQQAVAMGIDKTYGVDKFDKLISDAINAANAGYNSDVMTIAGYVNELIKKFDSDKRELIAQAINEATPSFGDWLVTFLPAVRDFGKSTWGEKAQRKAQKRGKGIIEEELSPLDALEDLLNRITYQPITPIFGGGGSVVPPKYQAHASGGFPDAGEIFMARENGIPELVGRFGGRAAVANNDQITEGIYRAVRDAMMESQQPANRTPIAQFVLDGKTFYGTVVEAHNAEVKRKGYSPLLGVSE